MKEEETCNLKRFEVIISPITGATIEEDTITKRILEDNDYYHIVWGEGITNDVLTCKNKPRDLVLYGVYFKYKD